MSARSPQGQVILEEGPPRRASSSARREARAGFGYDRSFFVPEAGKTLPRFAARDKTRWPPLRLALRACGRIWADRLGRGPVLRTAVAARAGMMPAVGLEMDAQHCRVSFARLVDTD